MPLDSNDTRAAVDAYRLLGAGIQTDADGTSHQAGAPLSNLESRISAPAAWLVQGNRRRGDGARERDRCAQLRGDPAHRLGTCALLREGLAVLTGDEQIRRRPAGPLAESLNDLGATVRSTRGTGVAPFVVEGRLRGAARPPSTARPAST